MSTATRKAVNLARAALLDQLHLALGQAHRIANELKSPLVALGLTTARNAMANGDTTRLASAIVGLRPYLIIEGDLTEDSNFVQLVDSLVQALGVTNHANFSQQFNFPTNQISAVDRDLLIEYLITALELAEDFLAAAAADHKAWLASLGPDQSD